MIWNTFRCDASHFHRSKIIWLSRHVPCRGCYIFLSFIYRKLDVRLHVSACVSYTLTPKIYRHFRYVQITSDGWDLNTGFSTQTVTLDVIQTSSLCISDAKNGEVMGSGSGSGWPSVIMIHPGLCVDKLHCSLITPLLNEYKSDVMLWFIGFTFDWSKTQWYI